MSISATFVPSTLGDDDLSRRLDELERQMSRLHAALTQKNREIEKIRTENARLKSQLQAQSLSKPLSQPEPKLWQQRPADRKSTRLNSSH